MTHRTFTERSFRRTILERSNTVSSRYDFGHSAKRETFLLSSAILPRTCCSYIWDEGTPLSLVTECGAANHRRQRTSWFRPGIGWCTEPDLWSEPNALLIFGPPIKKIGRRHKRRAILHQYQRKREVPMDAVRKPPSASSLMYLFADRVALSDRDWEWGTPVPCSKIRVNPVDLAGIVLPVAFWSLREQGAVALELAPMKRRRRASRAWFRNLVSAVGLSEPEVRVQTVFSWRGDVEAFTLEGAILDELRREGKSYDRDQEWRSVFLVVSALFGLLGPANPWRKVVDITARSAAVAGFTDCGARAEVRENFEELLAQWNRFKVDESLLHYQVAKKCTYALSGASLARDWED
jgi:hypothetical protein